MISENMKDLVKNSSVIRSMFEDGKKLEAIHGVGNVFDFSLGNPYVEPPQEVKDAIIEILSEENSNMVHGYMSNAGYEDVRKAIADYTNKEKGTNLSIDNIIMTCGAAGGLNIIFKSLLNPGDEVITFSPYFGEYNNYVDNYNGKLVTVKCDYSTFQPDLKAFEEAINEKTKVVIVNTPNNPTGAIYSHDTLSKMAEILYKKQEELNKSIYLVSDEPYRELVYDDTEVPYLLNYYKNSFIGYSYSKSLSLPGERIGYITVNGEMDGFEEITVALSVANRILGFVNAPSLFQRVIGKTLGAKVDVSLYKENRDILYNHLISLGFECVKPEGAFYLFPKALIEDDVKFCNEAKKYNLIIVPGSSFGAPGYFRIAYCVSREVVNNSLQAFTKLSKEFK